MKKIEKGATTDVAETKDEETLKIVRMMINEVEFNLVGHCPADSENELDTDDEKFIEHEEEIYKEAKQVFIYKLLNSGYFNNYEIIGLVDSIDELDINEQMYKLADLYKRIYKSSMTADDYNKLIREIQMYEVKTINNYNEKLYSMNIFDDERFFNAKTAWWIWEVQKQFKFDFSLYLIELLLELDEDEIADETSNIITRLAIWGLYQDKVINEEDVAVLMSRIKECKLTYEFFDEKLVDYWKSKALNGKKFEERR